jgi:hypothetical protein
LGFFFGGKAPLPLLAFIDLEPGLFQKKSIVARIGPKLQFESLCFLNIGPLFQTNLSVWCDDDGGFSFDRASLLAKSTTIALGGNDDRTPIPFHGTKDNRVIRADLITDETYLVLGPDQTHLFP